MSRNTIILLVLLAVGGGVAVFVLRRKKTSDSGIAHEQGSARGPIDQGAMGSPYLPPKNLPLAPTRQSNTSGTLGSMVGGAAGLSFAGPAGAPIGAALGGLVGEYIPTITSKMGTGISTGLNYLLGRAG